VIFDILQEAAVECLAAVTQHSHEACQQLLQHTAQQQPASTQQIKQAAAALAQPPVAEASEQQQQGVLPSVVQRLLQLMREYHSRLRFQCAACICHLSKGAQQHSTDKVRSIITPTMHNMLGLDMKYSTMLLLCDYIYTWHMR
jgi:hypothetical protein